MPNKKSFSIKISLLLLSAVAGFIFLNGCSLSRAESLSSDNATAIPAFQSAARVGPCVNMANHLEAPVEGAWGRPVSETDFADIAAAGFATVRLPVRFSAHALKKFPYTIDQKFMARVDHLVQLARASGLKVILNLHNYEELYADPAAHTARFVEMWRQIAEHFSRQPASVWFELINEPHDALRNHNLHSLIDPALVVVRSKNPTRKVVIGGDHWSNVASLATLDLPDDPNVIATFHYYEPFNFTHQGAKWIVPTPPMGTAFGSPADIDKLRQDVGKVQAYMARTGKPVLMGEYGAYESISLAQRAQYYGAVHNQFQQAGIDGCVWGYTNSFPVRKGSVWLHEILRAIGL